MSTKLLSTRFARLLSVVMLASLATVSWAQAPLQSSTEQPTPDMKQQTAGAGESEVSDRVQLANANRSPTGRLPRYFASVVDQKQRLRIYEIQSIYRSKIEEIERQLAELRARQLNEIEQVLTPTQLERVEEMRSRPRLVAGSNRNPTSSEVAAEKP